MGPPLVLALIIAFAFGVGHGFLAGAIGFAAGLLIYLAIGAVVWMGRNRDR